jgi:hypothetical protein
LSGPSPGAPPGEDSGKRSSAVRPADKGGARFRCRFRQTRHRDGSGVGLISPDGFRKPWRGRVVNQPRWRAPGALADERRAQRRCPPGDSIVWRATANLIAVRQRAAERLRCMFTPALAAAGWLAVRPSPALGSGSADHIRTVTGVTARPSRNVYCLQRSRSRTPKSSWGARCEASRSRRRLCRDQL